MRFNIARFAATLLLLTASRPAEAADATPSGVGQVVVFGDSVLCGYKNPDQSYEIAIARLGDFRIFVTVDISFFEPDGRESLVVDGEKLYVASTHPLRQRQNNLSFDRLFCLSIAELSHARWVDVAPSGKRIEPILALPTPWSRDLEEEPRRIRHTALCSSTSNKLWMFDSRKPAEGQKSGDVVVSEMTPVFDEAAKNWDVPKQIVKETIPGSDFTESFHPYHIAGDFFFVTRSGKVYSALKPEKDRPRALVDMKLPFTVRYAVDNGNGTYHLVGTNKDGHWRYAKLGREIADRPLNVSDGFDKLKPIKAAVEIVKSIKADAAKK